MGNLLVIYGRLIYDIWEIYHVSGWWFSWNMTGWWISIYWEWNNHPNWRTHIFQRGSNCRNPKHVACTTGWHGPCCKDDTHNDTVRQPFSASKSSTELRSCPWSGGGNPRKGWGESQSWNCGWGLTPKDDPQRSDGRIETTNQPMSIEVYIEVYNTYVRGFDNHG